MVRSFTIKSIYNTRGGRVNYTGGRFISETPSGAAKKAFSKAYHSVDASGPLSLKIKLQETTRGSLNNIYEYRVTRKSQKVEVERDGELITYHFITKVKSI